MEKDYLRETISDDSSDVEEDEQIRRDQEKYRNGRPAENIFKEIHNEEAPVDHTYDHLRDKETDEFKARVKQVKSEARRGELNAAVQGIIIKKERELVHDDIKANEKFLNQDYNKKVMDRHYAQELAPEVKIEINFDRLKLRLQKLKLLFGGGALDDLMPGLGKWAAKNSMGDPVAGKQRIEKDFINQNKLDLAAKEAKKKQMTEQEMR